MEDTQARNREVLEAVRVRRDALYDTVMALERALATPTGGQPAEWADLVRNRVENVQSVLERHVAETEREGGFFDDVLEHAPHLRHAADRLRSEHRPLLERAAELERSLDGVREASDCESVRSAGVELIRQVLEHRHRGAELVYDAYSVDISAAD